jgi:hypothetical protein
MGSAHVPYQTTPQVVPADLGQGDANLQKLAAIIYSLIDDVSALVTALETHTHTALNVATITTVTPNTVKQPY